MAITLKEAKSVINEFIEYYPITKDLNFCLRNTVADLYGEKVAQWANIQAAYSPYLYPVNDRNGRVDIVLERTQDRNDLFKSLRHEILGHYALNTFNPADKKLLLDNIIYHKPDLKSLWDYVETHYKDEPLYIQAEEVFCRLAEEIIPKQHLDTPIKAVGENNFRAICYFNLKALTEENLKSIALMAADGISDQSRKQKTFPQTDLTASRPLIQIRPPLTPEPEQDQDLDR